jgi:RND family efflux transporter MFP subunit
MQTKQFKIFIGRYRLMISGCIMVLLLVACGKSEQTPVKVPSPSVEVAEVIQQTIRINMDFSATIKAVKSIDIIPRVAGYIVERYFTEGEYVKEGDALYLIDPKPYQVNLKAARAQLVKNQANVKLWEAEAARYTRLAKQGAGTEEDKEKAIAHREEYRAATAQDQANIDNAELQLGYTHITAPFEGRVQQTRINIGQLVQQQKDVLTTLVQIDPIHVIFNVSRTQSFKASKLRSEGLGLDTFEQYKATIWLPDGSPYPHQGAMDYLSAQVDPSTDTYEARALFPNPRNEGQKYADLVPGQYTPLALTVGHRPDALLIPQPALVQSQAGTYVYVLGKDNKVDHRKVEVGDSYEHYWVVEKGLSKGERVIIKGVQKVRQGMTVTIVKPEAAGKDKTSS